MASIKTSLDFGLGIIFKCFVSKGKKLTFSGKTIPISSMLNLKTGCVYRKRFWVKQRTEPEQPTLVFSANEDASYLSLDTESINIWLLPQVPGG